MSDDLNALAMSALLELKRLDEVMSNVNDYGAVTGFCDQTEQVRSRLKWMLRDCQSAAYTLRMRVERSKEEIAEPEYEKP